MSTASGLHLIPRTPLKQIDTVTFPSGTQIFGDVPNPQMTRLELMVGQTNIPAFMKLIGRLFPAYAHLAHPVERLCIYRLDKKELYEVGRIEMSSATSPDVINAWWLADGKHIQFLYNNALYIVPIN